MRVGLRGEEGGGPPAGVQVHPAWSVSQQPQREDSRRKLGRQGQRPDDTLSNLEAEP